HKSTSAAVRGRPISSKVTTSNDRDSQISRHCSLCQISRMVSKGPPTSLSAMMAFIAVLQEAGLTQLVSPKNLVLGMDRIELGLNLWRVSACAAVQHFLVFGHHFVLVV